jgi:hypothetical protein
MRWAVGGCVGRWADALGGGRMRWVDAFYKKMNNKKN